jgi:BirA family biotin operon repressor/biotin-[acetyl-CoA-carboxylase] ligase
LCPRAQDWQAPGEHAVRCRLFLPPFCYNLAMNDAPLTPEAVQEALTTRAIGRTFRAVETTGSTNDDLKAWAYADPPAPDGTVLLAEYQSAGRGRLDRRWEAAPGTSLLFSTLFRPGWPAERANWLTMIAGLAVVEAIEATIAADRPLQVGLKWPNDIVIEGGGRWRKTAGLLLDSVLAAGGTLETAILGIGLNVNLPADVLPAAATPPTSLMIASGRPQARLPLLAAILAGLERRVDAAEAGRSPRAAWEARLVTLGQAVTVSPAGGAAWPGVAESVTEEGHLLVRDTAGAVRTVSAGDVSLRG